MNPSLLAFATLTIEGDGLDLEEAPLWDGRAFKLGLLASGDVREYTVTLAFDAAPDHVAWVNAAYEPAELDLDVVGTQVKGNDDPSGNVIGYGG